MRDDAAFCLACGTTVQSSAPPVAYGPPITNGKAVASLILGLLSFVLSLFTGIPAIILGHISRTEIRKSAGRMTGDGMALAGLILGYISVAWIPIVLIIAAIAIPNLMRSRMAANHAAAAATVRTLNTVEITYSYTYPQAGYADLATLGPGGETCQGETQTHACLIDDRLGCSTGNSGQWCIKDVYRYSIVIVTEPSSNVPKEYIITATPTSPSAAETNYCSTSDGVVRLRHGTPLVAPVQTASECTSWSAL